LFKKGSVLFGLNYSFANNTIQSITTYSESITIASFQNLGKNSSLGFNTSISKPLNKSLNVSINGRISYAKLEGFLNNTTYANDGFQGSLYGYLTNSFKNDWRASLNAGLYSSAVLLQGSTNSYYYTSIGLSKGFLKKMATFSATVSNPFQKYRTVITDLEGQYFIQKNITENMNRNFNIGFSYRFGRLSSPVKKNKRTIKNDDQIDIGI
jgi:hypothetical protein